MLFVTKDSTKDFAKKESGGKGYNLFLLTNAGLPIPSWVTLGPRFFHSFLEQNKLSELIGQIIEQKINNPKQCSIEIEKHILNGDFSINLKSDIIKAYCHLDKDLISVRSSALDEDGSSHSFAGQLSSFLYIRTEEALLESIKKCWASAFSERCLSYRIENKLDIQNISVAVVLQEMIDPDKSGVIFTIDPIKKDPDSILINSVYGVGEGLVSGLLEGDTFKLKKNDLSIEEQEIVPKNTKLVQDIEAQDCIEVKVEGENQEIPSLDSNELNELGNLAKKIEKYYRYPQDIEFAIKGDKVYLLQSRPITSGVTSTEGTLYVWDNSNIVESYGGLTLPLTFNFAHYVYNQVYVQFCEILMVPHKRIREMSFFLKNMLGLFYGRVYYNLLNWYKLTSILPGYKFNRKFMETMMGTDESLAEEIAERVRPPSFDNTLSSKLRKILTGFKFFYFHLNIQNVVDNFMKHFYSVYDGFTSKDYSMMPADEILKDYQILEEKLLWKWHAPIINDFLCMVHFGLFKKLTEKWLSHLGDNFHNDLLAGNGKLESAEPTKKLILLAGEVSKDNDLKALILGTDKEDCLEALKQSRHQDFYNKVLDYIHLYGFRCMSEMKLEEKDMHLRPSLFFIFLKNIINAGQVDLNEYERREQEIREKAENQLKQNITGFKKVVYKWSLKHARKAVMNRENTRFCRTRVYGIVRRMFYGMGSDFVRRNIIDKKEDIFYLGLHELMGALEGTNHIQNLRAVIELRKEEYEGYKDVETAPRFHTRGPVYWLNQHFPIEEEVVDDSDLEENQVKGLGCSPGIVEGVVKVINGPEDDLELNGEILVTHRTDPGWIPLYPSINGLLVERGGLLSHSAVVAREMGLPTIVSVKGLTKKLETGMKIRMNGETGLIELLN